MVSYVRDSTVFTGIITADVRQPWTNPHDLYFEYLIVRFDYLIIRFDYSIIG